MNQLPSKLGANNTLFQHDRPNQPNSSSFDLSRFTNFTLDAGMIVPFDTIPTLPGDEFDINFNMLLDTLPLVLPSITQYKVVTHWYYMKNRDIWKGWKTFSTKGRTGNINKTVPKVDLSYGFFVKDVLTSNFVNSSFTIDSYIGHTGSISETYLGSILPIGFHSLAAFLGVPPSISGLLNEINPSDNTYIIKESYLPYTVKPDDNGSNPSSFGLIITGHNQYRYPNALPFVMYQSIVKHNYVNQNLLQSNTALFPEQGDDDWILPYNATIVNYIGRGEVDNSFNHSNTDSSGNAIVECRYDGVFTNQDNRVRLDQLRYAQFGDDPFTTGLPWLQRGDTTTLKNDIKIENADVDFNNFSGTGFADLVTENDLMLMSITQGAYGPGVTAQVYGLESAYDQIGTGGLIGQNGEPVPSQSNIGISAARLSTLLNSMSGKLTLSGGTLEGSFTANQLRELLATSVWQERNARVDGSYNKMIFQHWKVNPQSEEHIPVYIGGTADYISFATVLQNSESSSNAPLGSMAGYGSSRGGSRVCSRFYAPDYGYIMGVMIITPVTTYSQGVEHHLCCLDTFEDCVQPEFEGLSPEPQLIKELWVADNDSDNEDLLNYQERYMYYKVRMNQNRGMFYSAPNKDILFSAMVQSRWFSSKPEFSYQFLCMSPDNIRRDWLAYPNQPMFRVQTSSEVYVNKRRLAYASEPNTFGF